MPGNPGSSLPAVLKETFLPRKTMLIAGWLAMASAFFTLPLVYLSYRLEGRLDATAVSLQSVMQVAGTLMFVAITVYLRRLLNGHFSFHATDRSIGLLIKAALIAGALTLLSLHIPSMKDTTALAVIVTLVAQGIVQVQFGFKLRSLPADLGGLLQPFCYANIATGFLIATIVLIPLGVLASAIADLMLGTIFFNLARQSDAADTDNAAP